MTLSIDLCRHTCAYISSVLSEFALALVKESHCAWRACAFTSCQAQLRGDILSWTNCEGNLEKPTTLLRLAVSRVFLIEKAQIWLLCLSFFNDFGYIFYENRWFKYRTGSKFIQISKKTQNKTQALEFFGTLLRKNTSESTTIVEIP